MKEERWQPILDRWERFLERPRSFGSRYGVMLFLLAPLLALSSAAGTRSHLPISFLYLAATVLSAFYGGIGPGIIAGFLSSIAIDFFYLEPVGEVLSSWPSLFLFIGVLSSAVFLSFLTATLRLAYQRARREQQLAEESTRAREHTLAVVSHDLRQPLTAISLQMQLLQRSGQSPQAERVMQSVHQMQRLIQDLLDASKIEGGGFALRLEPRDIHPLISGVVEAFRRQAEVRGVRLDSRLESSRLRQVEIDETRMRQVLSNLLDNALKFTPEGGTVQVEVKDASDGTVEIRISDSGPGILRENLTRIFDRNWQAKETAHLGSGLGLYIARGIVGAHQGRIWAESEPGQGAAFIIRLPARGKVRAA